MIHQDTTFTPSVSNVNNNTRLSVLRSQLILLVATVASLAMSLGVTVWVGRMLSPQDFGLFAFVAGLLYLCRHLLDLGTGHVAAREMVQKQCREDEVLRHLLVWRRLTGAVLAAGVACLAMFGSDPHRMGMLLAVAAVLMFVAPGALYPVFQVRQAQGGPAVMALVSQSLILLGCGVFYLFRVEGRWFAWLVVMRQCVELAGIRHLVRRLLGYTIKDWAWGPGFKGFVVSSLLFGAASLMHHLYVNSDILLVSWLRGDAELGAYAAAYRPFGPILILPWVLMTPIVPVMASAAVRDRRRFYEQVWTCAAVASGVGLIGAVVGFVLARDWVHLLYGQRYLEGPLRSVVAFRWLSVSCALGWVTPAFVTGLMADGRERTLLAIGGAGLIINVVGNFLLLPRLGFQAAAMTTALTELFVGASAAIVWIRSTDRPPSGLGWGVCLMPALIMGVILLAVSGSFWLRIGMGFGLALVSVLFVLMSPAAKRHRQVTAYD